MDIIHKVAVANVIVNNFDDIITLSGTSIDEEVLNILVKQEEKDLEENFSDVAENEKEYELERAKMFQHSVLDLLEKLVFILKEQ